MTAYADYTRTSESPDLFHYWTGVFTIAGALRRRVWIPQRLFQWTPNFYIVLVGPAGIAAKSTSLRLGTKLLRQVDGVEFGPRSMTWQALTQALAEAHTLVPFPNDELKPMSCISCAVSELGTFLRPADKEMMDVLIDLWDGQEESWERKTVYKEGQVTIENPWINLMGCTTPSWIRDNMPEAMIGGGLVRRIVFVYGDKKRHLVPYPADLYKADEYDTQTQHLIDDLRIIAELQGEYVLTEEAKVWGREWYINHWAKRPDHMISDRYGGYIATKQTHIHKLAIVLAAAARDELTIEKHDLEQANVMMTSLERSMQIVFQSIGVGEVSRYVQEILAYVRAYAPNAIEKQVLWRHMMAIMDLREFADACNAAIQAGYMRIQRINNRTSYVAIQEKEEGDG